METPSSTKRETRSQTLAALNNNDNNIPISRRIEDSEKGVSKSTRRSGKQQQDRSALIDITNDSPIVGVAMGSLETPASAIAKQRSNRVKINYTPGSGEAKLRGQVKTLLQKVEEEAELSKVSLENRPFLRIQGFVNSPMGLLAPTPVNTPQVPNLSEADGGIDCTAPLSVVEEPLLFCQVVSDIFDGKKEEGLESQKSLTRSLMLDFSEKSEITDASSECPSVVATCEVDKSLTTDDDSASDWSIRVNASTHEEEEEEEEEEYYDPYDYEVGDDGGLVDALCEGIGKIRFSENNTMAAKFRGKHTRFRYNSDDEVVEEEEVVEDAAISTPNVLHLKGLPTPKGRHLRFPEDEDDDDD